MEDAVVGAAAAVAVGLPALEGAIVDLGNDAGRGLEGVDPVVGGLGSEELRLGSLLLLLLLPLLPLQRWLRPGVARRRWRCRGSVGVRPRCAAAAAGVEAAAVNPDPVHVGDGQTRGLTVAGAIAPEAHHEALGPEHIGVRPGADLRGRPEAVKARRVLPGSAKARRPSRTGRCRAENGSGSGSGPGAPRAAALEVAHGVPDGRLGGRAREDLAHDADAVAAQVAAEAGRLRRVVEVGKLDRRDEVRAEALYVLYLGAQGVGRAAPSTPRGRPRGRQ